MATPWVDGSQSCDIMMAGRAEGQRRSIPNGKKKKKQQKHHYLDDDELFVQNLRQKQKKKKILRHNAIQ